MIDPNIGPGTPSNKQLSTQVLEPGGERVIVGSNNNPLPVGLLYSCEFTVSVNASVGTYPLANVAAATDPMNNPVVGFIGAPGQIIVTNCTGDCNGNGVISIGEVTKCVNLFLGQPLCNLTDPASSCPVADANTNGAVSIGEVTQCVNRFLNGC